MNLHINDLVEVLQVNSCIQELRLLTGSIGKIIQITPQYKYPIKVKISDKHYDFNALELRVLYEF